MGCRLGFATSRVLRWLANPRSESHIPSRSIPQIPSAMATRSHPAAKAKRLPRKSASAVLPEWNLADLYAGLDAPEIKRDLDRVDADCLAFEEAYKGRLADLAHSPAAGAALADAVRRYEAIDDRVGRLVSYAGLVRAGDIADAARAKFSGDVRERITAASTHLLFFTLELNRIDDALIEAAMADPALGHYRPWIEDLRKEKPHQLDDRI
jgi:oligoendopeptidase F